MQIELEEKIVGLLKTLRSQAVARGMSLDAYLEQFVATRDLTPHNGAMGMEEFDSILNELSANLSGGPALPVEFSRADIYADHD